MPKKTELLGLYGITDFAIAEIAAEWQTSPGLVVAALRLEGKSQYTKEEAKKIIENFKYKEVL